MFGKDNFAKFDFVLGKNFFYWVPPVGDISNNDSIYWFRVRIRVGAR